MADADFEIVPDVVGSLGMARAFHHLMTGGGRSCPAEIFEAVGATVDEGLDRVRERRGDGERQWLAAALDLALDASGSSDPIAVTDE